jgi:predicted Zn finger-like uncharacterized protein
VKKVTTTCPSCNTSFRVTPQQLAAREGQVRCGHCNTLFNGLVTLAMADQAAETSENDAVASAPTDTSIAREIDQARQVAATQPQDESDAPILYRPDFTPPAAKNRKLWLTGSAVMALLLLLQGMTYFRHSLARDMPSMKPILATYCNIVGCAIALPRNAEAITIESSDLKQFPDRPKEILLTALLRNRANYEQAYPSLELTLTDASDQAVVKKIVHPADYVENKNVIGQGIAPLQEVNVRLRVELIDLAAVGYRLFVFYPQQNN